MAWVDRTSNAYWIAAQGASWNLGGWWDVPGTSIMRLQDTGTWATGYRPTAVRMTFSGGAAVSFSGEDASPNTVWWQGSYDSTASVACSWGAEDLFELRWDLNKGPAAQITKIEFLDIATTTSTTIPVCAVDEPRSDDFNNSSLEPFWTWQDVSAVGSYVEENTYLQITAGDWNVDDDPIPISPTWVYQDCTCAFDISTKVEWPTIDRYNYINLTVLNSYAGGPPQQIYVSLGFYLASLPSDYKLRVKHIQTGGSSGTGSMPYPGTPGEPIYLRMTRDQEDLLRFYFREEGYSGWIEIFTGRGYYIRGWSRVGVEAIYTSMFGGTQFDAQFDYFISNFEFTTTTTTVTTTTLPEQLVAPFDFFGEWIEPSTTTTTTVTWPPGVCVEEERYDPRWTENYFYSDWPQEYTFPSDHNTRLDHCGTFKAHGMLGYYPGDFTVDMRFEVPRPMKTGGVDSDYIGLVVNIEDRAVSIVLTSEGGQQKVRRVDSSGCPFLDSFSDRYDPTEIWLRISRVDIDFFTFYSYDRIKWYELTVPFPNLYSGLVTVHFGAKHRTGGQPFNSRYQFWTLWPDGPSWLESGAYLPHLIESDNFDDNDLNERWFKRHGTYFRPTPFFAEGCIWEADQVMKVQTSPDQFHGPYNEFNGTWAWQDVKGFFNLTVKVMVNPALIVDEVEMGIIARELPAEGEPSCRVIYTKESGVFYFKRVDTAADGSESETSIGAGILSEFWLGLRWYKDGFTASYSLNGVNWDPIAAPAIPITPTNWLQVGCAAKGWVSPGFVTTTTTTTTTSTTTTTT